MCGGVGEVDQLLEEGVEEEVVVEWNSRNRDGDHLIGHDSLAGSLGGEEPVAPLIIRHASRPS